MLRIVDGRYKAIIVLVLCSGICGLEINRNGVSDHFGQDNLNIVSPQLVEPFIEDENDLEVAAENDNDLFLTIGDEYRNHNEGSVKKTTTGVADDVIKRQRRQAAHGYTSLYPQLPSGSPYNPYQPQPGYNPYTTQPNQPQPGYNPYSPNSQQPGYNPYTQNPNQQPTNYNPYTPNPNQHLPGYNPYTPKPNQYPSYNSSSLNPYQKPSQWNPNVYNSSRPGTNYQTPSPYNPSGQNPYNPHSNYPYFNTSTAGHTYKPPYGQHPLQNQTFNSSPYPGYRPPNANSSYPGQSPYNNNYPSSGNIHPVQPYNSSGQRPPYSSPGQYPPYNNSSPLPMQPNQSPYSNNPYNPYNPSAPSYPSQNPGQNNFFYPQANNSAYDPRRVPQIGRAHV